MKLKTRLTREFMTISVDEVEMTIFKSDRKQIDEMISDLLCIVDELANYTEKSVQDYVNEVLI